MGWYNVLGSVLASGIGAGFGALDTSNTNETNLKIASDTNASNRQIAREQAQWSLEQQNAQNDFNFKMWQQNNEYNTPSNQLKRFQEAGLNPNFVLGNNGNSAAPVVQASLPSYERANMQGAKMENNASGLSHLFSTIGDSLSADKLAQARKANADAKAQEIKNDREQSADEFVNKHASRLEVRDTQGHTLTQEDIDAALNGSDDGEVLNNLSVVSIKFKNLGELEAYDRTVESIMKRSDTIVKTLKNNLDITVTNKKLASSEITDALSKMPLEEYNNLLASVAESGARKALHEQQEKTSQQEASNLLQEYNFNDWFKENQKNTTLVGLFKQFKEEGSKMSFGEFMFSSFLVLMDNIANNTHVSFSRRK